MKTKGFKILIILILLTATRMNAQNSRFLQSGVVHFEKKVNLNARIKKNISEQDVLKQQAFAQFKITQQQFRISKSRLSFFDDKSLFEPEDQVSQDPAAYFGEDPMSHQINIVFRDTKSKTDVTEKKVFEELFLIKDSTKHIVWKLTEETREIAGYPCKRANGLLQDSIYVVAFYTEKIVSTSGPESFGGLPGMILGLALPHENITWFATSIEDKSISPDSIKPPSAGRPISRAELIDFLLPAIKKNNINERLFLKGIML